jgi:hypothetical protein
MDHIHPYDSDFYLEDDVFLGSINRFNLSMPKGEDDVFLSLFMDMDIEYHIIMLCKQLLPCINVDFHFVFSNSERIILGDEKSLSYNSYLFQLRNLYKN